MTQQPHPIDPAPDALNAPHNPLRADLLWRPNDQLESVLEQAGANPNETTDDHA
jgi:hypothetical protein